MVEEGNVYWVNWTNNGGGSGSRENSSRSSENNFNNNNERSGENGSRWGRGRSNVKCQFVPKLIILPLCATYWRTYLEATMVTSQLLEELYEI